MKKPAVPRRWENCFSGRRRKVFQKEQGVLHPKIPRSSIRRVRRSSDSPLSWGGGSRGDCPALPFSLTSPTGRLAGLLSPGATVSGNFAEGLKHSLAGLLGLSRQPVARFPAPQPLRSRTGAKASTNLLLIAWIAARFDLVSGGS